MLVSSEVTSLFRNISIRFLILVSQILWKKISNFTALGFSQFLDGGGVCLNFTKTTIRQNLLFTSYLNIFGGCQFGYGSTWKWRSFLDYAPHFYKRYIHVCSSLLKNHKIVLFGYLKYDTGKIESNSFTKSVVSTIC